MGARGPKPKNPALKLLAGNPGKRPVQRSRSGRIRKGAPVRPPELTGEAAAEWDWQVAALTEAGTLAVTDRGILAAYCLAVADLLAARDAINRHGRWVEQPVQNSKGAVLGSRFVEHPAVKLQADASRRIEKLGSALGLNPSARSRLEGDAAQVESAPDNKVAAIRDRIQAARNGG
ncbi:Phage terminase, small subunit [Gemmata sp. SH-PL17]|uniref:phage terminase small subunit P27 family n=1 Tax=Gemmata sp. SH-PL17 TaxID=1630693 RepID=UPI00078C9918|nr:phage terminase small subunit P27 family [Gemmata sp. SH-PL17]AMV23434.1 Phage terminase, small subunit [Gemmata sp. SH-PL17]